MPGRYSIRSSATALLAAGALVGCTFAGSGLGIAQAGEPAASSPTGAAPAGAATVVFLLRPHDPQALAKLADTPAATAGVRADVISDAAPTAAAGQRTVNWLTAHGFAVADSTRWAVTATTDVANAAALLDASTSGNGRALVHEGSLTLPAALRADVAGAIGLDNRPVFHHSSLVARPTGTLGFAELHQAYDASTAAVGSGTTVATIQFSGWNRYDLTNYATASGITGANPAALKPHMDTSLRPAAWDSTTDGDGDFEVALDQESVLATAPGAAQRMYFAPNNLSGFATSLTHVLNDVTTGVVPITALSISWGACEQDLLANDDTHVFPLLEQTLQDLAAAGVTVFAASGDSGAYDCAKYRSDGTPDPAAWQRAVDFPGSSPYVVSVGGTRLTHNSSGWHETTWGPAWASPGRHVGTGGGYSREFALPAWQVGIGGQYRPTGRAVPDISSAADPNAGFGVYEKRLCGPSAWCLGGGTSAGAPAQAGLFVSALAAAGRTAGVGDIHGVLYGNPEAFRDIRTGSNGTFQAGNGWDLVTGLGSPLWSVLGIRLLEPALVAPFAVRTTSVPVFASLPAGEVGATWQTSESRDTICDPGGSTTQPSSVPIADSGDRLTNVSYAAFTPTTECLRAAARVVVDTVAPRAKASLPATTGRDWRVSPTWATASDGTVSSWAGSFQLRIRRYRDGAVVWKGTRAVPGKQVIHLLGGAAYRLEVQETDRAGNTGPWADSWYTAVPLDNARFSYTGRWRHVHSGKAYSGGIASASREWSRTVAKFTGSSLSLMALTTPKSGTVYVRIDGHYLRTVNLYSPHSWWRHRIPLWSGRGGTHTVTFTVSGKHSARSGGSNVWIDAVVVR